MGELAANSSIDLLIPRPAPCPVSYIVYVAGESCMLLLYLIDSFESVMPVTPLQTKIGGASP